MSFTWFVGLRGCVGEIIWSSLLKRRRVISYMSRPMVNLDITPVEVPELIRWIDDLHK